MCDTDADSDLELGIALSLSEQCAREHEKKPSRKIVRRKLLPAVNVSERSKKLLKNVYQKDKSNRARIEEIIDRSFQTLCIIGDSKEQDNSQISVNSLSLALKRLGYAVEDAQLQEMLKCYGEAIPQDNLSDYSLYTRETVDNRNVEAEWQPKFVTNANDPGYIDMATFRQIFLDCNLRMENNGLIY